VDAVAAAVEVAREHGLRIDEPRVLKDAHNLVVHLAPAPVVVRVGTFMAQLRPGIREREHVASELRYEPVLEHGDAHLNNCFFTAEGALWGDLEDAFLAPVEWDAACLAGVVATETDAEYERALAQFECDADRLRLLVVLRMVVMVVWTAMRFGPSRAQERLAWLRRNAS
jgi:Phosphotransferase enzyme family